MGETPKENTIHLVTSEDSIDELEDFILTKFIPPILRNSIKDKIAPIRQLRRVDFAWSNFNFVIQLLKPKNRS